jgi:formamidopyrimidine-DNA glycosylase
MGFELPEIINLSKQMETTIKGKVINEIILGERCKSIIKQGMCNLDKRKDEILNTPIRSIKSRGKWIFIEFENKLFLLLGEIIGKFLLQQNTDEIPSKYHVLFKFEDGSFLTFQSSLYAFLIVANEKELKEHKYAGNVGPSPLDKEFTYSYFSDILSKYKNRGIKGVLNLQGEISGLGNAYINDILYEACIHPKTKVSALKDDEKKLLYDKIIEIITLAVKEGGSSKEYDLFGEHGNYIRIMDQHSKNMECERCGTKIVKVNVLGSSSYLCPECQKI